VPMLFEKLPEKDQTLTKCGTFPVKTVLKSHLCQPFVMQGGGHMAGDLSCTVAFHFSPSCIAAE
jgi:hypothetical protein